VAKTSIQWTRLVRPLYDCSWPRPEKARLRLPLGGSGFPLELMRSISRPARNTASPAESGTCERNFPMTNHAAMDSRQYAERLRGGSHFTRMFRYHQNCASRWVRHGGSHGMATRSKLDTSSISMCDLELFRILIRFSASTVGILARGGDTSTITTSVMQQSIITQCRLCVVSATRKGT
jgi:hypothetical protein